MLRSLRIVSALLFACAAAASVPAHPLEGSWIGWAWLGDAGDLPLRVHVSTDHNGLSARFDSPAQRSYGVAVETVDWSPPVLDLSWTSTGGAAISLRGTVAEDAWSGTITWGKYEGTFDLVRSPRDIATVDPADYAGAAGFYERAPLDVIELRARPWGELVFRETRTGRIRTMIPVGGDSFFIGSGLYFPRSPEAELKLVRDGNGDIVSLVEMDASGVERSADRVVLASEPLTFEGANGSLLQGTLLLPPGEKLPAVVMLGGSSWESRSDLDFYARNFASMGFAVLSYDKRGYGESEGEQIVHFSTTARDATAAIAALEQHPRIDASRTGIVAMSRGGWYGPLATAHSSAVDFLVLLVPPAVSPAAQETWSRLEEMRQDGFDAETLLLAENYLDVMWKWRGSSEQWDRYKSLHEQLVAVAAPDYLLGPATADESEWAWSDMNGLFDPCQTLGMIDVPILAIFGERDIHVDAATNSARMRQCVSPHTSLTIEIIAGAGHNLSVPNDLPLNRQTGRGDEGYSIIADWAAKQSLLE